MRQGQIRDLYIRKYNKFVLYYIIQNEQNNINKCKISRNSKKVFYNIFVIKYSDCSVRQCNLPIGGICGYIQITRKF